MADAEFLDALRVNAADVLDDLSTVEHVQRIIASGENWGPEIRAKTTDLGWPMLAIPEEQGGMGGGVAELAILQEAYGAHLTPLPSLGTALLTEAVKHWPVDALQSLLLPQFAAGNVTGGIVDLDGAPALHLSQDHSAQLSGETIVLDGFGAHWLLVKVVEDGNRGLAILPANAPGTAMERRPVADRTRTVATLTCSATPVGSGFLITGDDARTASDHLRLVAALLVASDSIGGARAALETTVDYLKTRVQFGKPIGAFQALKHRAADLKVKVEMAGELVAAALARVGDPDAVLWAAMAKYTACEAYTAVAAEMVQMHGGIGFTAEHSAHLFLKRAGLNAALFGSAAVQQDRAAEALMARAA